MNHDAYIFAAGYLFGKLIEWAVNKSADLYVQWKHRPVSAPLTLPEYFGKPYHREPTYVEKVTEMLDRLEEK